MWTWGYTFQPLHGHLQAVQSRNIQTTTNILGVKISQDSQEELYGVEILYKSEILLKKWQHNY